jgi:CRP/FNR family cyclic AMP-dependent transcriptional regulator
VDFKLLGGVPQADVTEFISIARRRTFRRDEVVFHDGDPAESLHLISKGRFAVRIATPLGQSAMLTVLGPGEAFGEVALVTEVARRSATVSALEEGETFSVIRDDFFDLARRHPGVKDVLLTLLAEALRRASERIIVAHYQDAETRVRWALSRLIPAYEGEGGDIVIPLNQEQLAELAGVARPTVNRVLREEQERGTVVLTRGRVQVLRADELRRRIRGLTRS